jgi:hypothetical protein
VLVLKPWVTKCATGSKDTNGNVSIVLSVFHEVFICLCNMTRCRVNHNMRVILRLLYKDGPVAANRFDAKAVISSIQIAVVQDNQ